MGFEVILAYVMLAALILYALTGGADYGGGMWDLLAFGPRARRQREVIAEAIGPIWEANHVWLILVIVLIFTAFPPAFGLIMTALHIPMSLILVGIVLRGASFVFRKYDTQRDTVHRRWSRVFGIASFLTPFFLGLCLGAIASGEIRVADGVVMSGFFAGWTSPFAIACGLFTQGLFAFLAATYLTVDAKDLPEIQEDFRLRALLSGVSLAPAAALVFVLSHSGAPVIFSGLVEWWAILLQGATSVCAVGALASLWMRHFRWARVAAAGQVTLILLGWGLAQYPYLVVPDLTFAGAATDASTLRLLVWTLAIGAIVLFPSFGYLFHIFKRSEAKLEQGE
ncbi:MAG TPA: cytochrome d ubiquinol oxidase subunit II [Rhodothermales bacterium]|nr:cytochrome d ubiquinol oxidase subunit II [Rhodothermales bacterium]